MYKGLLRRAKRPFSNSVEGLKWFLTTSSQESVYFYTFHKCASNLFGKYVLKNFEGLRHIDYASQDYRGERIKKVVFHETGYVYGPIRLSTDPALRIYKVLVEPASDPKFIQDKIALLFVRDPRDILVSAYYSFGYSHGFSRVKEIRENQKVIRNRIQAKSVDEYVLDSANEIARDFMTAERVACVSNRCTVLKYEDMIYNFERFIHGLTEHADVDRRVVQQIFERSRPKQKENSSSHRRSGQPGGFRNKLKKETITSLNQKLEGVLERFQYEA